MKDIKFDSINEIFYFYTHSEKMVYSYNLNKGSIDAICDKVKGYQNNKSTGRIIAVDTDNFIFVKQSPFEILLIDGESSKSYSIRICSDYQMMVSI